MHNFIIVKLKVNLSEMFVFNEIFNDAIYLILIEIEALDYGTYYLAIVSSWSSQFLFHGEYCICILFVDIIFLT